MVGLVLEGGGAKGAFHCGAVVALYDNGYHFDGVAGTSIGAINGALIAQDAGYESMLRLWKNVHASLFTDFDDEQVEKLLSKQLSKDTVEYWSKQVLRIIKNLGIPTDKMIPFLQQNISEKAVRSSKMDFAVVTYNLSDRKPVEIFKEDIPFGELHNYILASAYYPAFRLKKLNGKYFVDGGVYDKMPVTLLAERGYDDIIAIRTMSKMPHRADVKEGIRLSFICPSEDLGGTADIAREDIERKIKLGYYDALRFIKGYEGKRLYIDGSLKSYFREAESLLHCYAMRICSVVRFESKDKSATSDAALVFDFLKTTYKTDIQDSIRDFIEEYALKIGMEKFRVYNPEEFCAEFKKKGKNYLKTLDAKSYKGTGAKEERKKDVLFSFLIKEA